MNFESYFTEAYLIEMPIGKYNEDIYTERVLKYGYPVLEYCALRYDILKQIEDKEGIAEAQKLSKDFDTWFGTKYNEVIADYIGQGLYAVEDVYDELYNFIKDRVGFIPKFIDIATPDVITRYFDYIAENAGDNFTGLLGYDMYKRADDKTKRMLSAYISMNYLRGLLKFLKKKTGFILKDFDNNEIAELPPADPINHATVYIDPFRIINAGENLDKLLLDI